MSAPPPQRRVRLAADLTKVATSVAVAGVLLYTRNATSVLYVTGAAANSIVGKLLKKVIRQPRPTSAKSDPGMPSSHATSLAFLSLAGLGVVVRGAVFGLGQGVEIAGAVLCVVVAVVACSWRVAVGYHTVMQVVAGWMLGTVDAVVWSGVVVPWARKGVEEVLGDEGRAVTVVVGIILVGCCVVLVFWDMRLCL